MLVEMEHLEQTKLNYWQKVQRHLSAPPSVNNAVSSLFLLNQALHFIILFSQVTPRVTNL